MTVQEMKERKKLLGYTNEMISELSGVPLGTVQKIFAGVTASPRYDTLLALEKVLKKEDNKMAESVRDYLVKRPGEYTVQDYYALPKERRVELMNGVIYDMAAPSNLHQLLCTEIWQPIKDYIKKEGGQCIPFVAPADVQLDCDDKTMVQPDVFVVCDRRKLIKHCTYGAPDFIVEILSESEERKI